jgi:hypothetical protein
MILLATVYAQNPLSVASYAPSTSKVRVVDIMLHTKESIIHALKDNLVMVKN